MRRQIWQDNNGKRIIMTQTIADRKATAKHIVQLLPNTNCGKCGYDNCCRFAKAVDVVGCKFSLPDERR